MHNFLNYIQKIHSYIIFARIRHEIKTFHCKLIYNIYLYIIHRYQEFCVYVKNRTNGLYIYIYFGSEMVEDTLEVFSVSRGHHRRHSAVIIVL